MPFFVYTSLPNLITLGRLVLVPVVIAMISAQRWEVACVIFVLAGVSDAVDGWLAKTFDLRTELGAYLDPVADKALLMSIDSIMKLEMPALSKPLTTLGESCRRGLSADR